MKTRAFHVARWDAIARGISAAVVLMGLAVIAGWHLHLREVVQLVSGAVPMQYNTALAFIAIGVAGLGLKPRRRSLLLAGGIGALLLSAPVLVEYLVGEPLGIDTFFFYPWEQSLSAHPGRMALTTAAGFVLTSAAATMLALRPASFAILGLFNAIAASLALTSLVGYAYDITYIIPFSLGSQMALHTALAMLVYALTMLGYAWIRSERGADGLPGWAAGVGIALFPVLFVGAAAPFAEQSWRATILEALLAFAGVAATVFALRKLTTTRVAYKGAIMIAMPLFVLLMFAALVARVKEQNESALVWERHSTEVLAVTEVLPSRLTEAQNAVRGFVITGDESFVDTSERASSAATQVVAKLRTLVGDNPAQEERLLRIGGMTAERVDTYGRIVALVRTQRKQEAEDLIKTGRGTEAMHRIGIELDGFKGEEARLSVARQQTLRDSWQRLDWLLVSGTGTAILLSGILTLVFSGGISRRLRRVRDNALNLTAGLALAPMLSGADEIAELDRVFHRMAASLGADGLQTDVRHAEALLKTGALQRAIFNSENFSSIATDAKGVIQIFNVGAERMLGYTAEEVMDVKTPADISDPQEVIDRAEALSAELGTTITPGFEALVFKASRGIEDIYELTYIRKDGSRFPAVVSVTALRDPEGAIIGYLLIGTDNTARKQVEAAQALLDQRLRDQQFYTRSLIESNIDALMTTDPEGIISDVNQQMIELTGRNRDELIGSPCRNFFTEPDRADAAIERVLVMNRVTDFELTVRAKNGVETVVSYNAATFHDRERKLQGVFAAARDVTERRLIERTLEEKNVELEHASRMKSEFLATMSHELRTPLNAIIGFSEALQDGLVGGMSAIQHEYIGDIFTSGQHLLALINDILDLSKVEAGMMALELDAVDLNALLASSLSIVREKASDHRIRLELLADENLGTSLLDERKTKQIIYNLLSNAVKFTPNGGRVTVKMRRVRRSDVGTVAGDWPVHGFALAPGEFDAFFELSVRDSGIGISRVDMARLFQAFSQVDSSLARKFEGTGLGLAMVKQLAELHGGSVAVASAEGKGAQFVVWLPVRALDPATAPTPVATTSDVGLIDVLELVERTALVIEDDDSSAELIRLLLEAEGFVVLRAASGEEASQMVSAQPLALITLDIQLPGMDGWEFLQRIRLVPNLAQVPVVIIASVAEANLALSRGASAVLQKPIGRAQLKMSLANLKLNATNKHVRTILVVDDDPKAVEVIAAFLPAPAYAVVRAYGGNEAIALARRLRPDLILLDLMMPDVTGFDVVEVLQRSPETARIPIIIVTAKQITQDDITQLNDHPHGVVHVVAKVGFNRVGFINEVRRALLPH